MLAQALSSTPVSEEAGFSHPKTLSTDQDTDMGPLLPQTPQPWKSPPYRFPYPVAHRMALGAVRGRQEALPALLSPTEALGRLLCQLPL
jgi:hypothetical protein